MKPQNKITYSIIEDNDNAQSFDFDVSIGASDNSVVSQSGDV